MAFLNWDVAWQTTVPNGATQPVSILDNSDHEIKENVGIRFEQGGHILTDDPNSIGHGVPSDKTKDGRHVVDAGGSGIGPDIYNSDAATKLVTFEDDTVTVKSDATLSAPGIDAGNNPGHAHDTTIAIPLSTNVEGRVTGLIFHNRGNDNLTLIDAKLIAFSAPSSVPFTLQMVRLAGGYGDPSIATGTDVFTTRPQLTAGQFVGDTENDIAQGNLAVGQAWVFEIDSNVDAADVTLILKVRRA